MDELADRSATVHVGLSPDFQDDDRDYVLSALRRHDLPVGDTFLFTAARGGGITTAVPGLALDMVQLLREIARVAGDKAPEVIVLAGITAVKEIWRHLRKHRAPAETNSSRVLLDVQLSTDVRNYTLVLSDEAVDDAPLTALVDHYRQTVQSPDWDLPSERDRSHHRYQMYWNPSDARWRVIGWIADDDKSGGSI